MSELEKAVKAYSDAHAKVQELIRKGSGADLDVAMRVWSEAFEAKRLAQAVR